MAKKIILLSKELGANGDDLNIRYAFWLTPTVAGSVRMPGATSAFAGATAGEVQAIQSGQVIEQVAATQYPSSYALSDIQSDLEARYHEAQQALASAVKQNEWYGTNFDGTAWNQQALAPSVPVRKTVKPVNVALAVGDNTILPAVPGMAWFIDRAHLSFDNAALATVVFKDGTTEVGRAFVSASKDLIFTEEGEPWIQTSPGNALIVNASAPLNAAGRMWFRQV